MIYQCSLFKYRAGQVTCIINLKFQEKNDSANSVETEEHFLISCHKYKDIRKTVIQSYGLDLKDSHNIYVLLSKLLNPKNIIECNYLYKFIRDALEIGNTS